MKARPFPTLILLLIGLIACNTPPENVETPTATAVATEPVSMVGDAPNSPPPAPTPSATDEPPATQSTANSRPFAGTIPAPDFPSGLDWLNVERPLSLGELRGKIVLLDFWTYGCINCIHVIPELHRLEEKFADELVVIGVHSAKFANESETENIRQIIQRYELAHPVINDSNFEVWQTYGATAWPTFVLIDPEGNVLGFHAGEGIYDLFNQVITSMVAEFDARDLIDRTPLELKLEQENLANSPLLFPGKVLADAENNRLFIADSNHNRIVVTDLDGVVQAVIGNGRSGLQDGSYETAQFFRPQGLTLADANTLYVADTENHAIRKIDLVAEIVETVAGNGRHGSYEAFEGVGTGVALNSPWDVLHVDGIIYIAMAGQHQLWQYDPASQIVSVFAGSGREELLDGPLLTGGLNQPSGLATDGQLLYFADSEASAIRSASLSTDGVILTIVGTGLFDFGDVDGSRDEVRLQHPLGVVYADGLLYVADTYNNKIKLIDPVARTSSTLFGSGEDGWRDGDKPLFDEPGGLSLANNLLYIADTNNHVIRIANLVDGVVNTLVLADPQGLLTRVAAGEAFGGKIITLEEQTVAPSEGILRLDVTLPDGYKFNEIAPYLAEFSASGGAEISGDSITVQQVLPSFPQQIPVVFTAGAGELQADLVIYYCEAEAESLCLLEQVRLLLPLEVGESDATAVADMLHTIPLPPNTDN
ncbi:thioredoxin-like domain-containing protein [Candidatus Leptofilum sp.]|uniref:thioredoxin-like domain-containing protein n=1 Tax=Candidatus Leptofilum sp. TaxID=3241576 RepID=UPI003B5C3BC5